MEFLLWFFLLRAETTILFIICSSIAYIKSSTDEYEIHARLWQDNKDELMETWKAESWQDAVPVNNFQSFKNYM